MEDFEQVEMEADGNENGIGHVAYDEVEMRRKIFKAAKTGNQELMGTTLGIMYAQDGSKEPAQKILRKKDAEGRYAIQLALMGGYQPIVKYLVDEWEQAYTNVTLTIEQDQTVLHQALASAYFLSRHDNQEAKQKYCEMVQFLVGKKNVLPGAQIDVNAKDRLGRTVLHIAALLGLDKLAGDLVQMGADLNSRDLQGLTALHYAIQYRQVLPFKVLIEVVVQHQATFDLTTGAAQQQTMFDLINETDAEMTLASHCVINQSWQCLAQMLIQLNFAKVLESKPRKGLATSKMPSDFAEECDLTQEYDQLVAWFESSNGLLQRAPSLTLETVLDSLQQNQNPTLLITDSRCMEHAPFLKPQLLGKKCEQREQQPENSDRLAILIDPQTGIFTRTAEFSELLENQFEVRESTKEAQIADVLKVHDFNYILKVIEHIRKLEGSRNKQISMFDGQDTACSEKTWQASLLAAGAVIEAVDAVMKEGFRNAFCVVRPPGHHAGIFGKTFHCDDTNGNKACSNGFCFINNVAVAAAYLKSQYRAKIKKIAIVDFDVHHGNGTQEIIETLIKPKAFVTKTNVSPFSTVEITAHQFKPWLDFDDGKNVLFTSVHLFDFVDGNPRIFFPGTGSTDENTSINDTSVYPGGIFNVPILPATASAEKWRQEFTEKVFPRLMEFEPDFIFISAGFDAHERDPIHSRGDTGVTEFDYKWVTEQLQKIANQTAQGRIVSVLEGGYKVQNGHLSPLAQSVAAHVRALVTMHSGSLINEFVSEQQYFSYQAYERSLLGKRTSEMVIGQFRDVLPNGMQLRNKRQRVEAADPKQEPVFQTLQEEEFVEPLADGGNQVWLGEDIDIEIEQQTLDELQ